MLGLRRKPKRQISLIKPWKVAARRGAFVPCETNGLACPIHETPAIENIGEYRRLSNPKTPGANKNPRALARATGTNKNDLAITDKYYIRYRKTATALCLAILACDPADACEGMAVDHADLRAGTPVAPSDGLMSEARIWAEFSTQDELKSYCAATFEAMPARYQAAFLGYSQGRAAA